MYDKGMKKALIVLDMQNVCVGKNNAPIFQYNKEALIWNVNKVIESRQHDLVVYIRTVLKNNPLLCALSPLKVFEGSPEANLVDELTIISEHVLLKYRGDAFSNPELAKLLKKHHIDEVEIIGVDGAGCVVRTANGAIKNGFKAIINVQATDTNYKLRQKIAFKKLKKKGVKFI